MINRDEIPTEKVKEKPTDISDWFGFWHFVFFLITSVIIIVGLMSLIFLYFWTHVF